MHPHAVVYNLELAGMSLLAFLSVFLPLEAAVFAGGPMIALVSLLFVASKLRFGPRRLFVPMGVAGALLGVLLATHDYMFTGSTAILVHLCTAIALLALAVFLGMTILATRT